MGLLIWLVLAQSVRFVATSKVYHLVNEQKSWQDAQSYCRETFTDLASIESAEDQARVNNMMNNIGVQEVWIGLYSDVNNWMWSRDRTYLGSNHNLLINFQNEQDCAYIMDDIQIYDGNCEELRLPVCYNKDTHDYFIGDNHKTWREARKFCKNSQTVLASVRDEQEKEKIMTVISGGSATAGSTSAGWWIGLTRHSWRWSDQSTFSFKHWTTNRPHPGIGLCAYAASSNWNSSPCDNLYSFICSAPPVTRKVVKIVLKTNGSLDLNDPMVEGAIMEHVDQQLRGQGIPQGVKLSWRKQPHGDVFNNTKDEL